METSATGPAQVDDHGPRVANPPSLAMEEELRPQEERMVMYAGFAIGLIVGIFFLTYIVIAVISGEATTFAPAH